MYCFRLQDLISKGAPGKKASVTAIFKEDVDNPDEPELRFQRTCVGPFIPATAPQTYVPPPHPRHLAATAPQDPCASATAPQDPFCLRHRTQAPCPPRRQPHSATPRTVCLKNFHAAATLLIALL